MRSGYCDRGLKRDKVVKIARLSGCKNFVDERERERESLLQFTVVVIYGKRNYHLFAFSDIQNYSGYPKKNL